MITYLIIFLMVVIVFCLGFYCGKVYEKTALELTIENLNFEAMTSGNWEFSKDEVEYMSENK